MCLIDILKRVNNMKQSKKRDMRNLELRVCRIDRKCFDTEGYWDGTYHDSNRDPRQAVRLAD